MILVLSAPTAHARAQRYAVVNAGPADYDTAQQLLKLYAHLTPAKKPTPPVARKVPPRTPPRRVAPSKAPRVRKGSSKSKASGLSAPIVGKALRRALVGLSHDEAGDMAAAALKRGKRLYSTLKRVEAAEAFAQAVSLYDNHVAWKGARKALVEACTYLLLCHHARGQKAEALKVAARLRELTGNKAPKGVPAGIWQAYPLVALPLTPRRVLKVKAPAKAKVYLDDQLAGRGAQELSVGPGAHRIRVELGGHRVFFREVAAGATGKTMLVSLVPRATDAFADIRRSLSKLRRSANRWDVKPIHSMVKRLFIDHVLVCVLEGGSLKARWYSTRLKKWASAELSLPRPGKGDLRKPVLVAFTKLAKKERARGSDVAPPKDKKSGRKTTKLWKKWYFWVAAALVAGVVAAFAIKDSLTEEKVLLRVTRP